MYWRFLQVTFEGEVGIDAFSDIAVIDDVEFQENTACAKTAETQGKDLIIQIQSEAICQLDSITMNFGSRS